MTPEEIQIGHVYGMRVGKNSAQVRIESQDGEGEGWQGTFVNTGKPVAIASASKLLYEVVKVDPKAASKEAEATEAEAAVEATPGPKTPVPETPATTTEAAASPGLEALATSPLAQANEQSWDNIPDHGNLDGSAKLPAEDAQEPTVARRKLAKAPNANPKKLGCLDAAVRVLGEAATPMTAPEMIDAMVAKGYWSSPNGKTPAATLYSAILRELQTKGDQARFIKTERGKFTLRPNT